MSNYSDKAILEAGWFTGVNWSNSFMIVDEFIGGDLMLQQSSLKCKGLTSDHRNAPRAQTNLLFNRDVAFGEHWLTRVPQGTFKLEDMMYHSHY